MKSATTFLLIFLAIIVVCRSSSPLVAPQSSSGTTTSAVSPGTRRNLEGGFDIGAWASGLLDEVFGGIGGGGGSGDDFFQDNGNFSNDYDDYDDAFGNVVNWGNDGAWDEWLSILMGGDLFNMDSRGDGLDGLLDNFDFCTIVEVAIGMAPTFGVEANCDCRGDFETGLEVGCNFNECALGSEVCGAVDLNFIFGGPNGTIEANVCADFLDDQFEETCFSYGIDVRNDGNVGGMTQTCEASYGGQQCDCDIDNFCLSVDCSPFLPGAKMDTCQILSMVDEGDIANWFPNFELFQPDFELQADAIPWEILNFDGLDYNNFDMSAVQWGDSPDGENDWITQSWTDLIGGNPNFLDGAEGAISSGVCKLVSQVVKLTDELGIEGSCTCDDDNDNSALELTCRFSASCTDDQGGNGSNSDGIDIGIGIGIGNLPNIPLCGTVSMNLSFESLAQVDANVCIEYADFPETCYSYGIPVAAIMPELDAGQNLENSGNNATNNNNDSTPLERECSARYGEGNCRCTMDENFCMSVDCTDFEPLALTNNCQVISLDGAVQPSILMLGFQAPGENMTVSDGKGGEFISQSNAFDTVDSSASSASLSSTVTVFVSAIATTALLNHL